MNNKRGSLYRIFNKTKGHFVTGSHNKSVWLQKTAIKKKFNLLKKKPKKSNFIQACEPLDSHLDEYEIVEYRAVFSYDNPDDF